MIKHSNDMADAQRAQADLIVFEISRETIEVNDVPSLLTQLQKLSDSSQMSRRFQGNFEFVVAGYDEDPRDLSQIPIVRDFFKELTNHWPYWAHFIDPKSPTTDLLIMMLCSGTFDTSDPSRVVGSFNLAELNSLMIQLDKGASDLHARHGYSEDESVSIRSRWTTPESKSEA